MSRVQHLLVGVASRWGYDFVGRPASRLGLPSLLAVEVELALPVVDLRPGEVLGDRALAYRPRWLCWPSSARRNLAWIAAERGLAARAAGDHPGHSRVTLPLGHPMRCTPRPASRLASTGLRWEELHCTDGGGLAERTGRKIAAEDQLRLVSSPVSLRVDLDTRLERMWRDGYVSAGALWDVYVRYCYLTRMRDRQVLFDAFARGPQVPG